MSIKVFGQGIVSDNRRQGHIAGRQSFGKALVGLCNRAATTPSNQIALSLATTVMSWHVWVYPWHDPGNLGF